MWRGWGGVDGMLCQAGHIPGLELTGGVSLTEIRIVGSPRENGGAGQEQRADVLPPLLALREELSSVPVRAPAPSPRTKG